jgi:hypothetical protein
MSAYPEMCLVKMNVITFFRSIAMVLVWIITKRSCGNAMMNAYLDKILVKINVMNITSTAMVLVSMVWKMICGSAMMNAYPEKILVKMNALTLIP